MARVVTVVERLALQSCASDSLPCFLRISKMCAYGRQMNCPLRALAALSLPFATNRKQQKEQKATERVGDEFLLSDVGVSTIERLHPV